VSISEDLAGVSNAAVGCVTSRIVDLNDPARGTDFIPVCRDGQGDAVPDSVDADGNPVCAPFPAGRVPAQWTQTVLPSDGRVGMNPDPEGLTGLESWFWFEGVVEHRWPSPVFEGRTADCRVISAPVPVMYSAGVSQWAYEVADSRPVSLRARAPGSEEEPAARHVYRTKGEWEVVVRCLWSGSPSADLVVGCAQRVVPVIEVRSVLIE
jgi:hypothetical protein